VKESVRGIREGKLGALEALEEKVKYALNG
jgi:hypothetical protein